MVTLVPLSDVDPARVDALLDRAFGSDRLLRTASLVRIGAAAVPEACLAAFDGPFLVGTIAVHRLFWCRDGGPVRPLAWLGPLARDPERHGQGIGVALMDKALAVADGMALPVALIGDAPYYRRWGFSADATGQWAMPGPVDRARLLLRSGDAGAFSGPAHLRAGAAVGASA